MFCSDLRSGWNHYRVASRYKSRTLQDRTSTSPRRTPRTSIEPFSLRNAANKHRTRRHCYTSHGRTLTIVDGHRSHDYISSTIPIAPAKKFSISMQSQDPVDLSYTLVVGEAIRKNLRKQFDSIRFATTISQSRNAKFCNQCVCRGLCLSA